MVCNLILGRLKKDVAKTERIYLAKPEMTKRAYKIMHPGLIKFKDLFLVLGVGLCLYSLSLYVSLYTALIFGLCQLQVLLWGFKADKT
jgi:hypothetical protein